MIFTLANKQTFLLISSSKVVKVVFANYLKNTFFQIKAKSSALIPLFVVVVKTKTSYFRMIS